MNQLKNNIQISHKIVAVFKLNRRVKTFRAFSATWKFLPAAYSLFLSPFFCYFSFKIFEMAKEEEISENDLFSNFVGGKNLTSFTTYTEVLTF